MLSVIKNVSQLNMKIYKHKKVNQIIILYKKTKNENYNAWVSALTK